MSRKNSNISIALIFTLLLSLFPQMVYADSVDNSMAILKSQYTSMNSLTNSYWNVFAGKAVLNDEFDVSKYNIYDVTTHNQATNWQATDYAAIILELIAIGENPYNYKGKNYVQQLIDYYNTNGFWGAFANPIWSGLALEAAGADGYNSSSYINYAKGQLKNLATGADVAGWSLILLSHHIDYEGVREAVDTFKTAIKTYQVKTGLFEMGSVVGGSNAISTACVVSGLQSLGVDLKSSEWSVDGVSAVDALYNLEVKDKNVVNVQVATAISDVYYGKSVFDRIAITQDKFLAEIQNAQNIDKSLYTDASVKKLTDALTIAQTVSQDADKMSRKAFGESYFNLFDSIRFLVKKGEVNIGIFGDKSVIIPIEKVSYQGEDFISILSLALTTANIPFTIENNEIKSINNIENTEANTFGVFVNGVKSTIDSIKSGDSIVLKYCPNTDITSLDTILVNDDTALLSLDVDNLKVTDNINLPSRGVFGSYVLWQSSNEAIVSNEGIVTRLDNSDVNVKLTATVFIGDTIKTKDFNIVVQKKNTSSTSNGDIAVTFKLIGDTVHGSVDTHESYQTWIPKIKLKVSPGSSVYTVFEQVLNDNEMAFVEATKNYISSIKAPKSEGGYWLSEFDNGSHSGWVYTINGTRPEVPLRNCILSGGDDIVFQYTDQYTVDDEIEHSSKRPSKTPTPTQSPTPTPTLIPTPTPTPTQSPTPIPTNNPVKFLDISGWAEKYITGLSQKGIISGKTKNEFKPFDNITRAEIVSILYRISNEKSFEINPFRDISLDDWYYDSIIWASKNGIVTGYDGLFKPKDNVSRQDIAVMLYRYMKYSDISIDKRNSVIIFNDDNEIASYAKQATKNMQCSGIINGKDNNYFAPNDYATRAEAAKIIYMILELEKHS